MRIEPPTYEPIPPGTTGFSWRMNSLIYRGKRLAREICSTDCWKLSIPAILYGRRIILLLMRKMLIVSEVIQNNLQYVAASNLEAATFQVSYQMKILTTAAFSVLLLRKRLSPSQWLALLCLAIGVGIVQIQSQPGSTVKSHSSTHTMYPLTGFMAVVAACFTSGLAGVYFEMVLKNSQADLWVRNVQLSVFSILPALVPVVFAQRPTETGTTVFQMLFHNFGVWAWATVLVQVFGGLITAMVIKYSDNILKGFATSLSIVISFLASIALFDFQMTFTFILGSVVVLIATWLYNQPAKSPSVGGVPREGRQWGINLTEKSRSPNGSQRVSPNAPFAAPGYVSHSSSTTSLLSMTSDGTQSPEGEPIVGLRIPSEVDGGRMSRMASTSSLPSLNGLRNISN